MKSARLLVALLVSAAPFAAAAQTAGTSIGVAEWTHPDALAARPAEPARLLELGDEVVLREEVATGDLGAADFLFGNLSRLLVGPQCEVTLDRRYYDSRLDVEVKEYSLDTRYRCVAKAENLGAEPADLIIINTPHGQLVVSKGSVNLLLMNVTQARPGQQPDQQGSESTQDVTASMVATGNAFAHDGFATLTGFTSDRRQTVMRREDYVMYIDLNGQARGPIRDRTKIAAAVQRLLEGLVPLPRQPQRPIPHILTSVDDLGRSGPGLATGDPFPQIPQPPANCRARECRPVVREPRENGTVAEADRGESPDYPYGAYRPD